MSRNPAPRRRGQRAIVIDFPRQGARSPREIAVEWLDRGIFACLCVLALVTIQNPFAARWVFYTALILWVGRTIAIGRQFRPQPLLTPLLAFLVLLGIATALSYAPLLSWERMRWFTMLPLAVLVAQTITSTKQVRILVMLLLLGGAVSAALTGWQYLYGIGTKLPVVTSDTALFHDGIRSGDLVQLMNRHHTRSLGEWEKALESTRHDVVLHLHMARGTPITYFDVTIPRAHLDAWLASPDMKVERGRPLRAQGHLYHYVPYAGEMLQLAMLSFGLLVAGGARILKRPGLIVLFLALAAALIATVTRTYLAALLVSCGFALWLAHKRIRIIVAIALAVAFVVATIWVHKERGYGWLAPKDAGTEYRAQMWRDSLHIIPHHWLFGVGPDSVLQFGDQWGVNAYQKFPLRSHFHSTYIQLAVDCGLPCLGVWCWLMGAYLALLWRSWKKTQVGDWFSRGVLLGIFSATVGFVLASFVHYTFGDGEVMILVWLFMGLAMALPRLHQSALPA